MHIKALPKFNSTLKCLSVCSKFLVNSLWLSNDPMLKQTTTSNQVMNTAR